MRPHAALVVVHLVALVPEPHVVSQLVREDPATALLDAEAEIAAEKGDVAHVGLADDEVHEVGPDPVAQAVHPVHVAVRRVREPVDVDEAAARLGIRHLGPDRQRHAVADPARLVGPIGLGHPQVDPGLDGGGAAGGFARGRRVDDGHVDRDLRSRSAQPPAEIDGRQPVPPSDRGARPGDEEVQRLETRQPQARRERPRYAPVADEAQVREVQTGQLTRDRAAQVVLAEGQLRELRQASQLDRDRPGQLVPVQMQRIQVHQTAE